MRELTRSETYAVSGGHPIAGGVIGAIGGGVTEYSAGGDAGDIIVGATVGFATGFFGGVAVMAKSAYYGAVTFGMYALGGAPDWRDDTSS
ncbi:MAG TPA: hypothetical protein DEG76_08925 [Pseudohongiella sp.]|nr:hypothetical protein [Pseudohongiella sp.]HBX37386.1 hypothetical protein [Pseudohongiella sp.]